MCLPSPHIEGKPASDTQIVLFDHDSGASIFRLQLHLTHSKSRSLLLERLHIPSQERIDHDNDSDKNQCRTDTKDHVGGGRSTARQSAHADIVGQRVLLDLLIRPVRFLEILLKIPIFLRRHLIDRTGKMDRVRHLIIVSGFRHPVHLSAVGGRNLDSHIPVILAVVVPCPDHIVNIRSSCNVCLRIFGVFLHICSEVRVDGGLHDQVSVYLIRQKRLKFDVTPKQRLHVGNFSRNQHASGNHKNKHQWNRPHNTFFLQFC